MAIYEDQLEDDLKADAWSLGSFITSIHSSKGINDPYVETKEIGKFFFCFGLPSAVKHAFRLLLFSFEA